MPHTDVIPAIVAGILQGVVEWLPVSSKTLITLYFTVLGLPVQNAYNLGLMANFGSFFAAVYYFRRDVWRILKALRRPLSPDPYAKLLRFLVVGTLATGFVGIPLYLTVRHTFTILGGSVAMGVIGGLLILTGIMARNKERRVARAVPSIPAQREPNLPAAVVAGGLQGLAAVPGISRSAMTITPLLWMGFSAEEAFRLSFLMDVLALVGAGVVPLILGQGGTTAIHQFGLVSTVVMLSAAAVTSFLAIQGILGLARRWRTSTVTFGIAGVTLLVAIAALVRL